MLHRLEQIDTKPKAAFTWRSFVRSFLAVFVGLLAAAYLLALLADPYDTISFSLPLKRAPMSGAQRHVYRQIAHSGRFDAFIIGTSTSRLLNPRDLNEALGVRFANLAMDNSRAWEGQLMMDYIVRRVGPPKLLVVGLDVVWCLQNADRERTPIRDFPAWLYDDNPWNDLLYHLNGETVRMSVRLIAYHLGLRRERWSLDGYRDFLPPDHTYDAARAREKIWERRNSNPVPQLPPVKLSEDERRALVFPGLDWLDQRLAQMTQTRKVLAFMPVHVLAQPVPGTRAAAVEEECKSRIVQIAGRHGAKVIDWRIGSPMTSDDNNYWDKLHYRVPVAQRLARELIEAIRHGESPDGSYRILLP